MDPAEEFTLADFEGLDTGFQMARSRRPLGVRSWDLRARLFNIVAKSAHMDRLFEKQGMTSDRGQPTLFGSCWTSSARTRVKETR